VDVTRDEELDVQRDQMLLLRDDSAAAYEGEQREPAVVAAGMVADLETIRLVKNDKAEREFRDYEAALDEARAAYADRTRDINREHSRAMQEIEREFDKDRTHYEGTSQLKQDEVRLKFAKIREVIAEKVVVEGMRRGITDSQGDFGNTYTYDQHAGMTAFADHVTGKKNEHGTLQCARTLLDLWKARLSERSRSRQRRMVLAREQDGRASDHMKKGRSQR